MSNDVKKMIGHKHAWQMLQYAEDAAKTSEPWKLWEFKHKNENTWDVLRVHPSWSEDSQYRRKPVKWQPIGGEWFIGCDDSVHNYPSRNDYKVFERPTKEQAKRAAVEMRRFNRLLALRDELCGDDEIDWSDGNKEKYTVAFNVESKLWMTYTGYVIKSTEPCFSTNESAQRACDMLNIGEVEL